MCGRYLLREQPQWSTHTAWSDYWEDIQPFNARFNIAPSQFAPVVCAIDKKPSAQLMQWGFRPPWAKPSMSKINARSESMFESKMFAQSAHSQRCLIPADGFYEPKGSDSERNRPWYLLQQKSQHAFMMAGLWTQYKTEQTIVNCFCIITCSANAMVQPIHHRMPLIIPQDQWLRWLISPEQGELNALAAESASTDLVSHRVSDMAKNPALDTPACAEPQPDILPGENLSLF
ncbi:MAG: SOS response-associated peptidase [Gammaproteobacteria bacterium]|nr:SOS response-associated peptidase [Gammaproteobacteria bacterium]